MKEHKLGLLANIICSFLVILVYLIIINTSRTLSHNTLVFLNLYLAVDAVILIVSILSNDINPRIPKLVILAFYASACVTSCFVNGSNYMMFQLMLLSLGAVALFMSRKLLNLSMILNLILIYFAWIIPIPGVSYVFGLRDYLLNVVCLATEFVLLTAVQSLISEKEAASEESTRTVEELIRVIGAKREEAQTANRAKSDFLANMSHEIRTPINAVLGFNEMILRENDNPNVNEFANDIRSSGNSLLALVNDILDFSKIEAGKMEILPVTYDLGSMLNDLINIIGIRAQAKGLSFKVDVDPTLPHVLYGDEIRIKQVITNILTNAVKYTHDGYIDMQVDYCQVDDYQIELSVRVSDTGQGIRPEDMERLFHPFERLDAVRNRNVEGSGLGIPLTHTLLNLMGSGLEIESTYGIGSTFSFRLKQEVENWEPIGALDEALRRVKQTTGQKRQFFTAPAARILAVDDIPINLKVFGSLLKRTEIRIDTASSGVEALSMMRKTRYDVVFLDHMMPELDGLETLERMKSDRFNVNRFDTPVIALTANAVSGAREMYIENGFEDYLTKPIDSVQLESLLIKYLDPSLVNLVDESEADPGAAAPGETAAGADEDTIISRLRAIPDIDVEEGIRSSGNAEIFEHVIREYAETIDMYSGRIEDFYQSRDIDNFRIQVHALKSTSKMAGALKVSDMARELERAADAGDLEYLQQNTSPMLVRYRALKPALETALGSNSDEEKDPIDPGMLKEAFSAMREGLDMFDYDLIESVMQDVDQYSLPGEYIDIYKEFKRHIAEVDHDAAVSLLDKALGSML